MTIDPLRSMLAFEYERDLLAIKSEIPLIKQATCNVMSECRKKPYFGKPTVHLLTEKMRAHFSPVDEGALEQLIRWLLVSGRLDPFFLDEFGVIQRRRDSNE